MQNAEKVLFFVTPSGEQEFTKSYEVHTISFVALCSLCAKNHEILLLANMKWLRLIWATLYVLFWF